MRNPANPTIAVLGAINWDTTIFEGRFAGSGEEVPVQKVEGWPGGKGANAAVAASRLLGEGKAAFVGALGDDELAAPLRLSLRSEGVLTDGLVTVNGAKSGRAFIVVDGSGAKQIHTLFGANDLLAPRHLQLPGVSGVLSASTAVIIMDVPLPVAVDAAEVGRRAGSRVFYSPGSRVDDGGPLWEAIGLADELVVDRSELLRLTSEARPRLALSTLAERFPNLVIVATLGSNGCLLARGRTVHSVAPFRLEALGLRPVNSTGSGDAFLAAYACFSLLGEPPQEAARWGNLAGALKAASGETRGSPTRGSLESAMVKSEGVRGRQLASPRRRAAPRSRPRS